MRVARRVTLLSVVCFLFVRAETLLVGVAAFSAVQTKPTATQKVAHEAEIAERFAPVFYQALGDTPRSDYITNFDFDGDWRGDNNWDHADKKEFSPVRLEDQHALLYVEPKGHGIEAYVGDQKQTGKKDFLRYKFSGHAEDPSAGEKKVCQDLADNPCAESVGYELIPISGTLWPKAHEENNATYGENCDYGQISLCLTSSGGRCS